MMGSRGGRIDIYGDCNSPYSYFAFIWLRRNKAALTDHGIEVDFHPIFIGGLNVGSGNKPPWTLPAKAEYGKLDRVRAQEYFQSPQMNPPPFFPIMSLLPMRCMLFIKDNFSTARYEAQFEQLWVSYWQEHKDISKPEAMGACLSHIFDEGEVKKILEGGSSPKYKKMLTDETAALVKKGAFGAPWYLVTNGEGKVENFFGSDRFPYMLQYLGVPFTDIKIQPPTSSKI